MYFLIEETHFKILPHLYLKYLKHFFQTISIQTEVERNQNRYKRSQRDRTCCTVHFLSIRSTEHFNDE